MTQQLKLTPVANCYRDIFGRRPTGPQLARFIKQYGVTVITTLQLGRGPCPMMEQQQADSLIAANKVAAPVETPPTGAEVHIGCLEAKVEQLTQVVSGQTEALNTVIKANNLLADRLDKVLKSLGAT